jgi:tetratricopeptide (TPR) repeat protein
MPHLWITGPYRADRMAAYRSFAPDKDPQYLINCHRTIGGPYTGARALVWQLTSDIAQARPELVTRHSQALLALAPELRPFCKETRASLTTLATRSEHLRFFDPEHNQRLANGILAFLLEYVTVAKLPAFCIMLENVQDADPFDQHLLTALVRRMNPEQLSLVLCTTEQLPPSDLYLALATYTQSLQASPLTSEDAKQCAIHSHLPESWTQWLLQQNLQWRGQWQVFGELASILVTREPQGTTLEEGITALLTDCPLEIRHALVQTYVQTVGTTENILAHYAYKLASPADTQAYHIEQAQLLASQTTHESWALGAIPYHYEQVPELTREGMQALLTVALACMDRGLYDRTIELVQRGRQRTDPVASLEYYAKFSIILASVLLTLQRCDEAEQLYKEIRSLTTDPAMHIQVAYGMAMLYTRFLPAEQRDHLQAKAWLQQALTMIPQIPEEKRILQQAFHLNALALVEMHLDKKPAALSLVQKAIAQIELLPKDQHQLYRTVLLANRGQLYAYMEQWDLALHDFEEVIQLDPYYDNIYMTRAMLYQRRGQLDEVLKDATSAITYGLPFAPVLINRGNLLTSLGRETEALADYTAALDILPTNTEALIARAEIYRQRGQEEMAWQDYTKVIELYTTTIGSGNSSFELHYSRGQIFELLDREDDALADYAQALTLKPTSIDAIISRVMILYKQDAYEAAQSDIQRGLQIDADQPQLLCVRGLIESTQHHYAQAYQTFSLALEHDPSLAEAWTNRAIAAFENGQVEAAIADLTQAISLEESVTILSNRAFAYQTLQRWNEASDDYTRCLNLLQDDQEERQEIVYQLAQCYRQAGHLEQARADIDAYLAS